MNRLRADNFGDAACIDDADVLIKSGTYTVLIVVDGATTFATAFDPRTKDSHEIAQYLIELMGTFHCTPKSLCADMAFQPHKRQDVFRRFDIIPFLRDIGS